MKFHDNKHNEFNQQEMLYAQQQQQIQNANFLNFNQNPLLNSAALNFIKLYQQQYLQQQNAPSVLENHLNTPNLNPQYYIQQKQIKLNTNNDHNDDEEDNNDLRKNDTSDTHHHNDQDEDNDSSDGWDSSGNSIKRKNTTRETTATLKAWLYEHRKNPYPTKGEKVMLAIITKMTLTQISTWFANARRRLKKETSIKSLSSSSSALSSVSVSSSSSVTATTIKTTPVKQIKKLHKHHLNDNVESVKYANKRRHDDEDDDQIDEVQKQSNKSSNGHKKAKIWSIIDVVHNN